MLKYLEVKVHYILSYKLSKDYLERRATFREAHLANAVASHDRGELIFAGLLNEPVDSAVLIFKGESPMAAKEFAKSDPYVLNGLIVEWTVRPLTVAIGG